MEGRQSVVTEINKCLDAIGENEKLINDIKNKLKDETLIEDEVNDLHSKIEKLEDENDEHNIDISILQEILDKMILSGEDNQYSDDSGERYDSWDEVFTGGDY